MGGVPLVVDALIFCLFIVVGQWFELKCIAPDDVHPMWIHLVQLPALLLLVSKSTTMKAIQGQSGAEMNEDERHIEHRNSNKAQRDGTSRSNALFRLHTGVVVYAAVAASMARCLTECINKVFMTLNNG